MYQLLVPLAVVCQASWMLSQRASAFDTASCTGQLTTLKACTHGVALYLRHERQPLLLHLVPRSIVRFSSDRQGHLSYLTKTSMGSDSIRLMYGIELPLDSFCQILTAWACSVLLSFSLYSREGQMNPDAESRDTAQEGGHCAPLAPNHHEPHEEGIIWVQQDHPQRA